MKSGRNFQIIKINLLFPPFTLKTEPADSSETLVYLCHTIQHHIPENGDLHPSLYYPILTFAYFPCCIKKDYHHVYVSLYLRIQLFT
jgi:hypothetical protein